MKNQMRIILVLVIIGLLTLIRIAQERSNNKTSVKTYYETGELELVMYPENEKGFVYWENFYKNGTLEGSGSLKNGSRQGIWKHFYKNGTLEDSRYYKDGKQDGEWKVYDKAGKLL